MIYSASRSLYRWGGSSVLVFNVFIQVSIASTPADFIIDVARVLKPLSPKIKGTPQFHISDVLIMELDWSWSMKNYTDEDDIQITIDPGLQIVPSDRDYSEPYKGTKLDCIQYGPRTIGCKIDEMPKNFNSLTVLKGRIKGEVTLDDQLIKSDLQKKKFKFTSSNPKQKEIHSAEMLIASWEDYEQAFVSDMQVQRTCSWIKINGESCYFACTIILPTDINLFPLTVTDVIQRGNATLVDALFLKEDVKAPETQTLVSKTSFREHFGRDTYQLTTRNFLDYENFRYRIHLMYKVVPPKQYKVYGETKDSGYVGIVKLMKQHNLLIDAATSFLPSFEAWEKIFPNSNELVLAEGVHPINPLPWVPSEKLGRPASLLFRKFNRLPEIFSPTPAKHRLRTSTSTSDDPRAQASTSTSASQNGQTGTSTTTNQRRQASTSTSANHIEQAGTSTSTESGQTGTSTSTDQRGDAGTSSMDHGASISISTDLRRQASASTPTDQRGQTGNFAPMNLSALASPSTSTNGQTGTSTTTNQRGQASTSTSANQSEQAGVSTSTESEQTGSSTTRNLRAQTNAPTLANHNEQRGSSTSTESEQTGTPTSPNQGEQIGASTSTDQSRDAGTSSMDHGASISTSMNQRGHASTSTSTNQIGQSRRQISTSTSTNQRAYVSNFASSNQSVQMSTSTSAGHRGQASSSISTNQRADLGTSTSTNQMAQTSTSNASVGTLPFGTNGVRSETELTKSASSSSTIFYQPVQTSWSSSRSMVGTKSGGEKSTMSMEGDLDSFKDRNHSIDAALKSTSAHTRTRSSYTIDITGRVVDKITVVNTTGRSIGGHIDIPDDKAITPGIGHPELCTKSEYDDPWDTRDSTREAAYVCYNCPTCKYHIKDDNEVARNRLIGINYGKIEDDGIADASKSTNMNTVIYARVEESSLIGQESAHVLSYTSKNDLPFLCTAKIPSTISYTSTGNCLPVTSLTNNKSSSAKLKVITRATTRNNVLKSSINQIDSETYRLNGLVGLQQNSLHSTTCTADTATVGKFRHGLLRGQPGSPVTILGNSVEHDNFANVGDALITNQASEIWQNMAFENVTRVGNRMPQGTNLGQPVPYTSSKHPQNRSIPASDSKSPGLQYSIANRANPIIWEPLLPLMALLFDVY